LGLAPRQLFEAPTIAGLAALVGSTPASLPKHDLVRGPLMLTPIQRWFFELDLPRPQHWNQSVLFELAEPLDRDILASALLHVLRHHDALRLRFTRAGDGWVADHAEPAQRAPLAWVDLSASSGAALPQAITDVATAAQASQDLTHGGLLRAVHMSLGAGRGARLLLSAHHLAIDAVSWRILLEDLWAVYQQLRAGVAVQLPPKTISYQDWAQAQWVKAQTKAVADELLYWRTVMAGELATLLCDLPGGSNLAASAQSLTVALNTQETAVLIEALGGGVGVLDALLAAFGRSSESWRAGRALLIALEGHGRDVLASEVQAARTVGWFTSIYPFRLAVAPGTTPLVALQDIATQRANVPQQGDHYGLLRYLSTNPVMRSTLAEAAAPEVSINYLGQLDGALPAQAPFRLAQENQGPVRAPDGRRPYVIELTAWVTGGTLQIAWGYSTTLHTPTTIARWADELIAELRTIIACLRNATSEVATERDALFGWSANDLLDIQTVIDRIETQA
jgi:non-ribosomal peptide synthase protein (TIGR01720 family)